MRRCLRRSAGRAEVAVRPGLPEVHFYIEGFRSPTQLVDCRGHLLESVGGWGVSPKDAQLA